MADFTFQTGATKCKAAHIRWRPNSCALGVLPDHAYNLNYGGLDDMFLGIIPTCATEYAGIFWIIVEFDLTTLMVGNETVESALLTLTRKSAIAGTQDFQIGDYGALDHASWTEGTHVGATAPANGVTFHTYDGSNNWGPLLGGPWGSFYQPTMKSLVAPELREFEINATDTEYTFDVKEEVQDALDNESGILRLLIRTRFNPAQYYSVGGAGTWPFVEFHSNEAAINTNWPKLEVSAGAYADLTVEINPHEARKAGAMFRYRQNPSGAWSEWLPAGTYEDVLEDGNSYDVEYNTISGYDTPETDTIEDSAISDGGKVTTIGTYVANAGIVQVFIRPNSAILSGVPTPQWRLTGHATASDTPWYDAATVIDDVAPGNWTIEFSDVQGYVTPTDINIVVGNNTLTQRTGIYITGLNPESYPVGFAAVGSIANIGVKDVFPSTDEVNGSLVIDSITGTAHAGVPATSDPDECAVLFYELIFWESKKLSTDGNDPANVYPLLGGISTDTPEEVGRPRFVYRRYNTAKGLSDSSSAEGEAPIDDGTAEELLAAPISLPLTNGRVWLVTISVYAKKPYSDSWSDGVAPWSLSLPLVATVNGTGSNDISDKSPIPGNNFLSRALSSWETNLPDGVLQSVNWIDNNANSSRALPNHRQFAGGRVLGDLSPYGLSIPLAAATSVLSYHNVVRATEVGGFRANRIEFAT